MTYWVLDISYRRSLDKLELDKQRWVSFKNRRDEFLNGKFPKADMPRAPIGSERIPNILRGQMVQIENELIKEKQKILISSIKIVFDKLDEESKRKMILLTPDSARMLFNF